MNAKHVYMGIMSFLTVIVIISTVVILIKIRSLSNTISVFDQKGNTLINEVNTYMNVFKSVGKA